MKVKYPAEAFALGLILFSGGMKEAFLSGILVILSVVLAEFLKNMLENALDDNDEIIDFAPQAFFLFL